MVIGDGKAAARSTFGNEPFTPYNLLRYNTFQLLDSVTKFARTTRSPSAATSRSSRSENLFYFGIQSAYSRHAG